MLRIDKRKTERIEQVINWCQQDEFWKNNILSSEKLRIQFDKLELEMDEKYKHGGKTIAERIEEYERESGI